VEKVSPQENPEAIVARALDGTIIERTTAHGDDPVDVLVRPRGSDEPVALQMKWIGAGWPGDVRRVAERLPRPWPANLVFVARELSPGALEWLERHEANWADATGRARIVGPGGLLVIRDPVRRPSSGSRPFRWSASALALAELLLARWRPRLRIDDLAAESGWSTAQVGMVLSAFDAQGWTSKQGAARGPGAWRRLEDPDGLLSTWAAALADRPKRQRSAHRATRDVMTLLRDRLTPALEHVKWALTGWAGLELAAPYMTGVPTLQIYVANEDFAGPLSAAIRDAGLREVDEGARVVFWAIDHRALALAIRDHELPVASPPRLYADLLALGGRGFDAADHVKTELIDRALAPSVEPADE
jgi:hypothetical protein